MCVYIYICVCVCVCVYQSYPVTWYFQMMFSTTFLYSRTISIYATGKALAAKLSYVILYIMSHNEACLIWDQMHCESYDSMHKHVCLNEWSFWARWVYVTWEFSANCILKKCFACQLNHIHSTCIHFELKPHCARVSENNNTSMSGRCTVVSM